MKIGGLLKQSFIDWEGKTAAVIFTKGCNFRCPFCHNPELVLPQVMKQTPDVDEMEVFAYLESRKNWLDAVVVTGGEPCLHNDLADLLRKIKAMGFLIKLDTNGSFPNHLKCLIEEGLADFVAMDIKTLFQHKLYSEICGSHDDKLIEKVMEALDVLRNSGIDYQLRTTVCPDYHSEDMVKNLKKTFSDENYSLQAFRDGDILEKY